MDSLENASKSSTGFFKHVFNFDEDSKADMLNIVQYATLAIIPVVIVNKIMQKYVPEANEDKGSLEIVAELIFQILGIFISLFFINRIITYVPTYSGVKYPEFSIIFNILAVLMITLSLQTKLGDKATILVERITELWNGKSDTKNKNNTKKGNVKVTQPISQTTNQAAMDQSMYNDGQSTSINQLPMSTSSTQQLPDYNSMYQNNQTPLINAATPGIESYQNSGPMAANEVFGGMFGGSTF